MSKSGWQDGTVDKGTLSLNDLSLTPANGTVEGESPFPQAVLRFLHLCWDTYLPPPPTHKTTEKIQENKMPKSE